MDWASTDLADPHVHTSPDIDRLFCRLRAEDSIHWTESRTEPGFWSVTRFDDCLQVQRDTARFSSSRTNVLGPHRVRGDIGANQMLNASDPPRHRELRTLVKDAFARDQLSVMTPYVRARVSEALHSALAQGECDLVEVVAPVPVASIAKLLGVPKEDCSRLLQLTKTAFTGTGGTCGRAEKAKAHGELLIYGRRLVAQRRRQPASDVLSSLIHAADDDMLSEEELLMFFDLLMLGGTETTRHAAVGAVLALIAFPEQWARLREDASLIPTAVEEVLRWTSPSRHVMRTAREDVDLGGRLVRTGDDVVTWIVSANRDEHAHRDPELFDVGRHPNRLLSFGSGIHFCLGASLARLELTLFLEELLGHVRGVESLSPAVLAPSAIVSSIDSAPVRLIPN